MHEKGLFGALFRMSPRDRRSWGDRPEWGLTDPIAPQMGSTRFFLYQNTILGLKQTKNHCIDRVFGFRRSRGDRSQGDTGYKKLIESAGARPLYFYFSHVNILS